MMHEVILLQSVDHPNVIKCYGSFWKHALFYMVLELAEKGDLSKFILERQKKREFLEEQEVSANVARHCKLLEAPIDENIA